MKKTIYILLSVNLFSNEPIDVMDKFVYNYLLLAESKLESSPMVWQDLKEGYLRNYTLRFTDTILDSISDNSLSSYDAGLRHLYKIENLRAEIKKGGEYEHTIAPNDTSRYNINYFSSSIK
tara:strand:- start:208 stop:570 length:363 start_codon:yes stop_codon:yes gene_type:complete